MNHIERFRTHLTVFLALAALLISALVLMPAASADVLPPWPWSWTRVCDYGFGSEYNEGAFSMAEYNGALYAGTYNPTDGCEVWRYDGGTSWTSVATGGIGDPTNTIAMSMTVFGGNLYVGTDASTTGASVFRYDGSSWAQVNTDGFGAGSDIRSAASLIEFNGDLYCGTAQDYAQVFRYDGGTSWTQVNEDGFGNLDNSGCRSLAVYDGALYGGTKNSTTGCEAFRYDGGTTWTEITSGGFGVGSTQEEARSLSVYDGRLIAGTQNYNDGGCQVHAYDGSGWERIDPGDGELLYDTVRDLKVNGDTLYASTANDWVEPYGGQVWTFDGVDWQQINYNGFGDGGNEAVFALQWFSDRLFAACGRDSLAQVFSGVPPEPPWEWEQVNSDGFGGADPGANGAAFSMAVLDGKLYCGTWNNANGLEVWRYDGGTDWTNVGTGGLGAATTRGAGCMTVFDGDLYLGAVNNNTGGKVFRYDGGTTWTQVNTDGFGLGATDYYPGCFAVFDGDLYCGSGFNDARVWRYDGGTAWTQVNTDGFGNLDNNTCRSMAVFGGQLHAGTNNGSTGFEVFRYDGGTSWTQVADAGVDNADNEEARSLQVYGGDLYLGFANWWDGCGVYRYDGGTDWTRVDPGYLQYDSARSMIEFNGMLVVGTGNDSGLGGTQVWAFDGTDWSQINLSGFEDEYNAATMDLEVLNGWLYASTGNWTTGGEVWGTQVITPDLSAIKSAPLVAFPGQPFTYTITVTNNGTEAATGVEFNDAIPAHTTVVPDSVTCSDAGSALISVDPVKITGITVPAGGTVTITFQVVIDPQTPFNTVIENQGVFTCAGQDFPTSDPAHPGQGRPTEVTAKSQNYKWYLAEGSAGWGFTTHINLENPNANDVTARLTYMVTDPVQAAAGNVRAVPAVRDVVLPGQSQTVINPADDVGVQDFSTKIECLEGDPIAVDRTMTFPSGEAVAFGAHNSIGVRAPAKTWYLPEGSSAWGFECWTLIQNANTSDAHVKLTYMTEAGPASFDKVVPGQSRCTFNMADDIGQQDASIMVESDMMVIPERSMYTRWTPPGAGEEFRREGHCSIGTTAPARDYYLAEGSTAWGFVTYVLVQNPNATPAEVTLSYQSNGGGFADAPFTMPPNSRRTVRLNDLHPELDLSTRVSADVPIIAERAMYWAADSQSDFAMHDSIGIADPHAAWFLPDGMTSSDEDGTETYTLVQNPGDTDVEIQVVYLPLDGATDPVGFTDTVPARSRKTYDMADKLTDTSASVMVMVQLPGAGALQAAFPGIIVERSMYYEGRWSGTDTIGGWLDPLFLLGGGR
ncbi:MAG: DUF11 domain-containing protein [Actinobacteria bacterium]|nr:DUF11 domain-containing protein [Actinomycetota bacterium]MBU1944520.1 DUF11 domain-containing protein [Actinomycetota bacterium]MBU2689073.1 DUF11 domain-containing protein [Actinomycetota bacterium]